MVAVLAAAALLAACSGATVDPAASPGPVTSSLLPSTAPAKRAFDPFRQDGGTPAAAREVIANPTLAEVMKAGPLGERSLGRADAPVTIIKYASLTCPYCRQFQIETFPKLKREFIDTGKVRLILREFPIGFASGAATIALRCAPPEKYFALYELYLRQQRRWVAQEVRLDAIYAVAAQTGMTRAQFDSCRQNQGMIAGLKWIKDRGRQLGVIGTPNFFVNGKLVKSVLTMPEIRKMVQAELARPVASTVRPR